MTTESPYTQADLISEAGLCLSALISLPTVLEITDHLRSAYIPSTHDHDSSPVWGDLLTEEQLAAAAQQIHDLMVQAAPVGEWSVQIAADGLEASSDVLNVDGDSSVLARLHMAFHPDMPARNRQRFGLALAHLLAEAM
ncbi:hypothetical protein ACWF2L_17635 [Streptomyces anulatus]